VNKTRLPERLTVLVMKGLNETPSNIACRMRALADGVSIQSDADAIRRYANWIERTGAAAKAELEGGGHAPADNEDHIERLAVTSQSQES
jgi:hypothetical protein